MLILIAFCKPGSTYGYISHSNNSGLLINELYLSFYQFQYDFVFIQPLDFCFYKSSRICAVLQIFTWVFIKTESGFLFITIDYLKSQIINQLYSVHNPILLLITPDFQLFQLLIIFDTD